MFGLPAWSVGCQRYWPLVSFSRRIASSVVDAITKLPWSFRWMASFSSAFGSSLFAFR